MSSTESRRELYREVKQLSEDVQLYLKTCSDDEVHCFDLTRHENTDPQREPVVLYVSDGDLAPTEMHRRHGRYRMYLQTPWGIWPIASCEESGPFESVITRFEAEGRFQRITDRLVDIDEQELGPFVYRVLYRSPS